MNDLWPVLTFAEIDSTNSEAQRRASDGEFGPVWLVADAQTLGRGRLARQWTSPKGNLYTTALFREPGGYEVASRFPFAAALAVADVAAQYLGQAPVSLKWPNDVLIDTAKASGILIETGPVDGDIWVAAGIGINIVSSPDIEGRRTTYLQAHASSAPIDRDIVLAALRSSFAARLKQARAGFEALRRDWLARAGHLGQLVTVNLPSGAVTGTFETIDLRGGLVLALPDGTKQTIHAGDVELVKRTKI